MVGQTQNEEARRLKLTFQMGEELFVDKGYSFESCKKAIHKMYMIYGKEILQES